MGISIHAIVDSTCISRSDWHRVYDETVTILRAWPDPPVRPNDHHVAGTTLVAYTRDVVGPEGWHICGDATSRLMGESIELPRTLGVDDPWPPPADMALRVLDSDDDPFHDDRHFHWLLCNKTQGKPYHTLVLAVAMLVEHRLPHAAIIGGDFTREQAMEAQARLEPILGEVIPLPLAADPVRLHQRLQSHLDGEALDDAMEELRCRGMLAGIIISIFDGSFGSRPREELEAAVSCTELSTLDDDTRLVFDFFMGQAKALFGRPVPGEPPERVAFPVELAALDAPQLLRTIIDGRMTRAHLRLTEMAWDEIQRSSLDELRLLATLATHPTVGLVGYQLCLAVFESVAVRRFCREQWNVTAPIPPHEMPWEARLFEEGQSDDAPSAEASP